MSLPVFAIDAGNGAVKAVGTGRRVLFAAMVAAADRDWLRGYSDPPLLVDGQSYRVGDEAIWTPGSFFPTPDRRLQDPYVVPLIAQALWALEAQGPIRLATGIPLRRYPVERDDAVQAWHGRTLVLQRGDVTRTVTCAQVLVYPQGVAALMTAFPVLQAAGRWPAHGLVGLVDIGRGTTELVVVDAQHRRPRPDLSTSFELGVGTAVGLFLRACQDRVQTPVSTSQAERAWLTGTLMWQGQAVNLQPERQRALDTVAARLVADTQRWWRDIWPDLQVLVLVGTSAGQWQPAFRAVHNAVWVPHDPGFANVDGYWIMATSRDG